MHPDQPCLLPALPTTEPAGLGVGSPILTRLVMGALFPFGLLITLVCGAELYTGNTAMVTAAVLEKKASAKVRAVWCERRAGHGARVVVEGWWRRHKVRASSCWAYQGAY